MLSETFDMVLEFDSEIYFYIMSDNRVGDSEQWNLFTPEKKVLVAGPGTAIVIEDE